MFDNEKLIENVHKFLDSMSDEELNEWLEGIKANRAAHPYEGGEPVIYLDVDALNEEFGLPREEPDATPEA